MPGPVLVRFDAQVVIPLAEVKLIETSEPLIIVGSDLMAPPPNSKGWKFRDIGYDDADAGTIRFRKARRTRVVPLLAWPTVRPEMTVARPYTATPVSVSAPRPAPQPAAKPKPAPTLKPARSSFPPAPSTAGAAPPSRSEAILALIRQSRGQCL